jgi:hypothetical protein
MNLQILQTFEAFLETVPLERYRDSLMPVKTVEQDLPLALNPLPAIYETYWQPEKPADRFPDFEDFFAGWWKSHLEPLDEFISKYFWGCSLDFVRLGFKARLYRTLVSVLTQFHFAYTWRTYCQTDLEASADLDMKGIDALIHLTDGTKVVLQVKKETYRREARGGGRFAQRGWPGELVVEVPYTVTDSEDWQRRAERARTRETRDKYSLFAFLASTFQRRLANGFVVFQGDYPRHIEHLIKERAKAGTRGTIPWDEVLRDVVARSLPKV